MKITWKFNDGTISEVEVSEEVGQTILTSRRQERAQAERERYHCSSLNGMDYEGTMFADYQTPATVYAEKIKNKQVRDVFNQLTTVQQRRLSLRAEGMSIHEIAESEGVDFKAVWKSINQAIKKFTNNFLE